MPRCTTWSALSGPTATAPASPDAAAPGSVTVVSADAEGVTAAKEAVVAAVTARAAESARRAARIGIPRAGSGGVVSLRRRSPRLLPSAHPGLRRTAQSAGELPRGELRLRLEQLLAAVDGQ